MASDTKRHSHPQCPDERTKALLVLGVHPQEADGPCPEAEELAALADGRLCFEKRSAILEHIDSCNACFSAWMSVAGEINQPFFHQAHKEKKAGAQKNRLLRAAAAVAAAACLVLFLYFFHAPSRKLPPLVNQAYRTAKSMGVLFDEKEIDLIVAQPLEPGLVYGFSKLDHLTPASRAFLAGWATGAADLTATPLAQRWVKIIAAPGSDSALPVKEMWADSSVAHYYWMGRWSILVVSACGGAAPSAKFWKEQQGVLNGFFRRFKQESRSQVQVGHILDTLEQIRPHSITPTARSCGAAADELRMLSVYISGQAL